MGYTNAVVVPLPYAEAVERTRAALWNRASASSPRSTCVPR